MSHHIPIHLKDIKVKYTISKVNDNQTQTLYEFIDYDIFIII